ncbi:hypothetical protein I317_07143 [Kwoniella heveanensis CBS 569]|nr:hypothetical protein I317_07143 [Kwoniella heveanensis CBS 569]
MKAGYLATLLLSATLTLSAPAKLDDVLVSSDTIAALRDRNPSSGSSSVPALNNIGTHAPSGPSSGSGAGEALSPSFPLSMPGLPLGGQSQDQPQPARPAEYVSGALRQHNPQPRARALGDVSSLPIVGDMASSATKAVGGGGTQGQSSNSRIPKTDGLVDMLKSAGDLDSLKGKSTSSATGPVDAVLAQSWNGKKRLARRETVELGSDHLGRMIVKRGNEFMIQEPADQGRQWGGADELDDENDEPYWG